LEGSGCGLISVLSWYFPVRTGGKIIKNITFPAETRNEHLQDITLESYCYFNPLWVSRQRSMHKTSLSLLKERVERLDGTNRPIYITGSESSWVTCPLCVLFENRDQGSCAEQWTSTHVARPGTLLYHADISITHSFTVLLFCDELTGTNLAVKIPDGYLPSSLRRCSHLWDLWWIMWHWVRFFIPSIILVFLCQLQFN
jgi:hypothetical protein